MSVPRWFMAEETETHCPVVDHVNKSGERNVANPNLVSLEAGQVPSDDGVGERIRRYRLFSPDDVSAVQNRLRKLFAFI